MEKKMKIAVAIIVVVAIIALGVSYLFLSSGSEDPSDGATTSRMRELIDAYNEGDGEGFVSMTMVNFYPSEVKEYLIGSVEAGSSEGTISLTSISKVSRSDVPKDAVEIRKGNLEEDTDVSIKDWMVLEIHVTVTTDDGSEDDIEYALFFNVGGEWYLDVDSLSVDMDDWYDAWSDAPPSEHMIETWYSISKHELKIELIIPGEKIDPLDIEIGLSRIGIVGSNSTTFHFVEGESIAVSSTIDAEIMGNLGIGPLSFRWVDADSDGLIGSDDHFVIYFEQYVYDARYKIEIIDSIDDEVLDSIRINLPDNYLGPTQLTTNVSATGTNGYRFTQTAWIYPAYAPRNITFAFLSDACWSGSFFMLNLTADGTSRFYGEIEAGLAPQFGLEADSIVFHDVDGDGVISEGDYFDITFVEGWDATKNSLILYDENWDQIMTYEW